MLARRDLPELLESDAVFLRLAAIIEAKALEQQLGQAAARAFSEQCVFGPELDAARERSLRVAILADAHVAGGNAGDHTILRIEHLGCRKARKDLDTERLGLGGKPAADVAK